MIKCCGNCKFYQPQINKETGRALPSMAGKCTYTIPLPTIPICYRVQSYVTKSIWLNSGKDCPTYEAKPEPPKRQKTAIQMALGGIAGDSPAAKETT